MLSQVSDTQQNVSSIAVQKNKIVLKIKFRSDIILLLKNNGQLLS